jgi:hypothetical protein
MSKGITVYKETKDGTIMLCGNIETIYDNDEDFEPADDFLIAEICPQIGILVDVLLEAIIDGLKKHYELKGIEFNYVGEIK